MLRNVHYNHCKNSEPISQHILKLPTAVYRKFTKHRTGTKENGAYVVDFKDGENTSVFNKLRTLQR